MQVDIIVVLISLITTVVTISLGWLGYWIRGKFERTHRLKTTIQEKITSSIELMIDYYIDKLVQIDSKKLKQHAMVCKQLISWAPDKVLYEYAVAKKMQYKDFKLEEYEKRIGRALLAYRKSIGYKNWRPWKKITPELITLVFKAGWDENL